jgi:hypothetical protein
MTTERDYKTESAAALSEANAHPEVAAAVIQSKAIDRFTHEFVAAIDRLTAALTKRNADGSERK